MYLERRHLEYLLMIQEAGSLAKASERLHVTQSALSHQIKAIEHHFDISLFLRHTKPIRLSAAGLRLIELAKNVLPQFADSENELRSISKGHTGRLHISIECHACFEWLMPVLQQFKSVWPDVEVDIRLGLSFDSIPALSKGEVDLVISSDPVDLPELVFTPLFAYEGRLVAPPNHTLATKTFIAAEDLATETLITYPVSRDRLDVFKHFLQPAGIEPAAIRTSELTAMILLLVASNRGVAALPDWVLQYSVQQHQLVSKPLGEQGMHGTLYAAIRKIDENMDFMQAFIKQAQLFRQ